MSRRLLKAASLVALIFGLLIAVYLAAQWNAEEPLTFRVIGVTQSGEHTNTLRLEIRNSSPFTINIADQGGVEPWPISRFYTSIPTIYQFGPVNRSKPIMALKPGQAIERELDGPAIAGAFDGGLTYLWEPNSKAVLRRLVKLAEKWHLIKPPVTFTLDMRMGGGGPVFIPAPK
jgi:hypothetical protein